MEISGFAKKLLVGTLYPPHRSDNEKYVEHAETVEKLRKDYTDYEMLILGDFNLPKVILTNSSDFSDALFADYYTVAMVQ